MAIRMTGLNSGLDTESIISELVSAYKEKGTKYEKAQEKITSAFPFDLFCIKLVTSVPFVYIYGSGHHYFLAFC